MSSRYWPKRKRKLFTSIIKRTRKRRKKGGSFSSYSRICRFCKMRFFIWRDGKRRLGGGKQKERRKELQWNPAGRGECGVYLWDAQADKQRKKKCFLKKNKFEHINSLFLSKKNFFNALKCVLFTCKKCRFFVVVCLTGKGELKERTLIRQKKRRNLENRRRA